MIAEPSLQIRDRFEETCASRHSPSIRTGSGNQFWKVAAIILVLITVTVVALLIRPDREPSLVYNVKNVDSLVKQKDSQELDSAEKISDSSSQAEKMPVGIESGKDDLYADNYLPNPGFEALIGAQFRAEGELGITHPEKDTTISQHMVLTFTGYNHRHEVLELHILNNKGLEVKTFKELDSISLKVKMDFTPGLYYWKLLGEDELHQLGKIRIERD